MPIAKPSGARASISPSSPTATATRWRTEVFEITACGGFLLAERTAEHLACFREDEEAVFFSDFEECRAKIDRYLNDEPARARIAAAGQRRAWNSGYDNDSVLSGLLTKAAEMLAKRAGN